MPPRYLKLALCVFLLGALLPALARAQCAKTFGPMTGDQRPGAEVLGEQIHGSVARLQSGFAVVWASNQDVYLRRFDSRMIPLADEVLVHPAIADGVQDEPALVSASNGNLLVLWTDRQGHDGSGSGVFGRVYDPSGAALTDEFVVPGTTAGPQSGPQAAATTTGGWAVTWTGDADDNVYLRLLGADGAFATPERPVNSYRIDSQKDASVGVSSFGNILVAFVDHSGHGDVGTGSNLWGRTFTSAGVPIDAREYALNLNRTDGDQLRPRIATDGLGRFAMVWQDELGDGSSYGIYERIFDRSGAPLAVEAQMNTVVTGAQVTPAITVDSLGRQIVTWVDYSNGGPLPVIRARHMNAQGNPYAPDFQVNENPVNGVLRPSVTMDLQDLDIVFAYEGPGLQGNGKDVFVRRFQWNSGPHVYCSGKTNSQGCLPTITWAGQPSATSQAPFMIESANLLNRKLVLLFYGYNSAFTPFQGSTICVAPPLKRCPASTTGGNPGPATDCSGAPSLDFNARIRGGIDPGLVPGATVSARWYYRDLGDPAGFNTGLTDALRFAICP